MTKLKKPYIIQQPRWVGIGNISMYVRNVVHRATGTYLGFVWNEGHSEPPTWRFCNKMSAGADERTYKYRDEAAMQLWFESTDPPDELK